MEIRLALSLGAFNALASGAELEFTLRDGTTVGLTLDDQAIQELKDRFHQNLLKHWDGGPTQH